MGRLIVLLIALLQGWAPVEAQHAPSRLAFPQQAGASAQPDGDNGDDAERMVIVHEHQHVHEHTHEHEHVHEHEHSHEHAHEITIAAPAPAAAAAPPPAATLAPMPITTTPVPPTLEPAMSRVVVFDEQQLEANIQRVAGSLNTVTSQLNHLRDSLVRWGPSLTTLQMGAAADLTVVTGNQATFQRLRGTIGQAGVDFSLHPLLASIATARASSAAISTRLGEPAAPPPAAAPPPSAPASASAGGGDGGGAAEGNITHRIQTFNSTLILAKPEVNAKLEELNSMEGQLNENVTEYTDHLTDAATDETLRAIPNELAGQVTDVMSRLDH